MEAAKMRTENAAGVEETRAEHQRSLLDVSKIKGPAQDQNCDRQERCSMIAKRTRTARISGRGWSSTL